MFNSIKKYVFKCLHAYHLKRSDYCYGKIDESDESSIDYWGGKTAKHTMKCLKLDAKLIEMKGP